MRPARIMEGGNMSRKCRKITVQAIYVYLRRINVYLRRINVYLRDIFLANLSERVGLQNSIAPTLCFASSLMCLLCILVSFHRPANVHETIVE